MVADMDSFEKAQRKELRRLAGLAHERELAIALAALEAQFHEWHAGSSTCTNSVMPSISSTTASLAISMLRIPASNPGSRLLRLSAGRSFETTKCLLRFGRRCRA